MRSVPVQGKAARTQFRVPEAWEFLRHLGSGSYAAVAAFKDETGTDLAVKKVERVFDHSVLALRTLREVRILSHFRHPNVLGLRRLIIDSEQFDDVYMCLELMDGDLNQLIHAGKDMLTDYQVQCVLYQVLRGLLCLRRAHVIHRDLKPGNILVKAGGDVKIADLGLARTIEAETAETAGHDIGALTEYVVTRFYRAPEVVLTATRYTYTVDIWSLGCILGEMLTRQPLFEGKDALDQIRKIVSLIGALSADDMAWIPRSSPSWKFVERCSKQGNGEDLRRLVRRPGTNPLVLELLEQMLRFDPSRRISVEHALVHRYVDVFQAAKDAEVALARAVTPMDWSFDNDLCFNAEGEPKAFDPASFRKAFLDTVTTPPSPGAPSPGSSPTRRANGGYLAAAAPIAAGDSATRARRVPTLAAAPPMPSPYITEASAAAS